MSRQISQKPKDAVDDFVNNRNLATFVEMVNTLNPFTRDSLSSGELLNLFTGTNAGTGSKSGGGFTLPADVAERLGLSSSIVSVSDFINTPAGISGTGGASSSSANPAFTEADRNLQALEGAINNYSNTMDLLKALFAEGALSQDELDQRQLALERSTIEAAT